MKNMVFTTFRFIFEGLVIGSGGYDKIVHKVIAKLF